jgi:Ca-activated chloride channel family protein
MIAAAHSARPGAALPVSLSGCEAQRGTLSPAASLTAGEVSVKGALPPDVVTRIIRQNFGRFRMCYETALRKDPKLAGRVTARLTIDSRGATSKVEEASADLPDPQAVKCVLSAFEGLVFPQPEQGSVTVEYPISFRPEL